MPDAAFPLSPGEAPSPPPGGLQSAEPAAAREGARGGERVGVRGDQSGERLPGLSVVVPAFNEEGSLERVVRAVSKVASEIAERYEVIVIDDGSKDGTKEIARRLARERPDTIRAIRHPFNLGFGAGQKSGFGHARHEYVTLVPADGQFDVECLRKYVPLVKDHDVAVGYRVNRKDSWRRRVNTRIFRWIMRLLFGVKLRDVNWVKLFRRSILDGIDIESKGIGVDAEVMVKAKQLGCRFAEVEVSYLPRTTGKSTGDKLLNVIITILELLILFWRVRIRGHGLATPPPSPPAEVAPALPREPASAASTRG